MASRRALRNALELRAAAAETRRALDAAIAARLLGPDVGALRDRLRADEAAAVAAAKAAEAAAQAADADTDSPAAELVDAPAAVADAPAPARPDATSAAGVVGGAGARACGRGRRAARHHRRARSAASGRWRRRRSFAALRRR